MQTEALEIYQTREFTPAETDRVIASWQRLAQRGERQSTYQNVLAYLWYGFAGFLVLSIAQAFSRLLDMAPALAWQLAFSGVVFLAVAILTHRQASRLTWQPVRDATRAGNRYVLRPDGFEVAGRDVSHTFQWTAIQDAFHQGDLAMLLDDNRHGIVVIKDAFEGQDADGFCAELIRRWQASRKAT